MICMVDAFELLGRKYITIAQTNGTITLLTEDEKGMLVARASQIERNGDWNIGVWKT